MKKLASRKLWMAIAGILGGLAGLPGLQVAVPYIIPAYLVAQGLADAFGKEKKSGID